MRSSSYLFQYSSFIRTRILGNSLRTSVCRSSPCLVPTGSQARTFSRTISCNNAVEPSGSENNPIEEASDKNEHTSAPSNTDPSPEALLAAFEAALEDIESDTEEKVSHSDTQSRRKEEAYQAHLQRLEILEALPMDLVVDPIQNKCTGCGTTIQSEKSDKPGYIPNDVLSERDNKRVVEVETEEGTRAVELKKPQPVCQRCYRLRHYGSIESHLRVTSNKKKDEEVNMTSEVTTAGNELTPEKFKKCLEKLCNLNAVVIYLIDIFDFHGTAIPSLREIIGSKHPIILAVNKTDLLPKDYKPARVESWISQECKAMGFERIAGIHMISSTRGRGVDLLLAEAMRIAKRRRSDIYVVGAANVGKSSFINQLMHLKKSGGDRSKRSVSRKRGNRIKVTESGALTTSVIPGTTLDVIKIPLGGNLNLYDTPGLMIPHQLTNNLDAEELRAVLPTTSVDKVSFRLKEGKALYIGGLARIEMVSGKPFFLTCFFSSKVKVHPGKVEGAEEFTNRHVGEMLTPPFSQERYETLGAWVSKTFTTEGIGWKKASLDIVLSGLGWVALTGVGELTVRVCVPKEVGVFTREPLLPFEVKDGVSTYTGSSAVNRRQMKKKSNR